MCREKTICDECFVCGSRFECSRYDVELIHGLLCESCSDWSTCDKCLLVCPTSEVNKYKEREEMEKTVACAICGKQTEYLWKMKFDQLLFDAFGDIGKAHETGLCQSCDGGGANAFPEFDAVYEIVNLKTGKTVWKEK